MRKYKIIAVVILLLILVGGGVLAYQYYSGSSKNNALQNDETVNWKTFTDDKTGYSLKYPAELKVEKTSANGLKENIAKFIIPAASAAGLPANIWGFKSDFLVFDIYREQLEGLTDGGHPGYPGLTSKEDILGDEQALKNGQFGMSPGFSVKESQKVVKIDSTLNAKEFTTLGMYEVCDVLPTRTLIFFKNGYKVTVVLQAWAVDKITSQLPQYFKTDEANCGNSPIWKNQTQFYKDLADKTIDSETEAGIWYSTFDKIVSTINLF